MRHQTLGIVAVAAAASVIAAPAHAQGRPRLHVNTRWDQCSIVLDASLTQSAWRQFTREAGQLVYFRPLTDATPMGRGRFEFSFMQWQTNVDDNTSAWNDTFVHPDSTHWLYDGSGLQFPGVAVRAGMGSRTDVGAYFTKNVQANYGVYGLQLQQNLIRGMREWDLSARASFMSLFGPDDVALDVYGADLVANWRRWTFARGSVTPYAGVATFLASSREQSAAVILEDEQVLGVMGTVGAALQLSVVRVGAEASISRVPSFAVKLGVGR